MLWRQRCVSFVRFRAHRVVRQFTETICFTPSSLGVSPVGDGVLGVAAVVPLCPPSALPCLLAT